ncbi:extracellular solute-binding protein [Nonomuraea phyllanthi]|uniref:Extracellular solute-binding protein n=1 Tax=Nonomuraea phyllanthi TaxID=2219224 RepID=A0A5C4VNT5_9ACTN|nr:extracellular solute-binding protein [Nonomuraea phyllanthi]KAB8189644.1 extracellular solute-binding protein [Nonomuraea phyllanthi]QFY12004.1 extracellular solute-binding protein [Nonomuraea phyllanthi]
MISQLRSAAAAGCAALLLASGCGSGDTGGGAAVPADASPALRTLIEAAQKEGELVWYSVPAENIAKAVSDDFAGKYGIKVKFIRLTSSDLAQRFAAEAESGKPAADLFVGSYTPFVPQALEKGWTVKLADANIPDYPAGFPDTYLLPDAGTAVIQIQPTGIAVNTRQGGGAIKDWPDILDPKWKGKIILVDPRTSAAYTPFWNLIVKEYGEEYLTRLKAQNPIVAAGAAPATQQLAAGEAAIVMPGVQSIADGLKSKGAPVGYVQPPASTGPEIVPGLAAKAAHPNAARLFVHYLMSKEGNKKLNALPGSGSPLDPATLPARYTFNKDLSGTPAERINALLGLT